MYSPLQRFSLRLTYIYRTCLDGFTARYDSTTIHRGKKQSAVAHASLVRIKLNFGSVLDLIKQWFHESSVKSRLPLILRCHALLPPVAPSHSSCTTPESFPFTDSSYYEIPRLHAMRVTLSFEHMSSDDQSLCNNVLLLYLNRLC